MKLSESLVGRIGWVTLDEIQQIIELERKAALFDNQEQLLVGHSEALKQIEEVVAETGTPG